MVLNENLTRMKDKNSCISNNLLNFFVFLDSLSDFTLTIEFNIKSYINSP